MHFTTTFAATTTLLTMALAAPVALPNQSLARRDAGMVTIHNNCQFEISVDVVSEFGDQGTFPIAPGIPWTQGQQDFGNNPGGISLKLSGGGVPGVAQLEYTVNDAIGQVHYDLSLINGNPFFNYAQRIQTSDPNAPVVFCAPGQQCNQAYLQPNDNWADHAAAIGSNIDFFLC